MTWIGYDDTPPACLFQENNIRPDLIDKVSCIVTSIGNVDVVPDHPQQLGKSVCGVQVAVGNYDLEQCRHPLEECREQREAGR
jgi:hypothetical protein